VVVLMDNYDPYIWSELKEDLKRLKEERRAIIMVHNYQLEEVQEVADMMGDSYGLAKYATNVDADVIVLCGVSFMAETVKLLNPEKTVLLPEEGATCPMADMVEIDELRRLKDEHKNASVVSYVNTYVETKALSDICCTSSNAPQIVETIPRNREVIFVPDIGLGQYAERITGREMILWRGFCPTHYRLLPEDVNKVKREHPEALVVVHPECRPSVIDIADHVASTSGMTEFCKRSDAEEFIIGTEIGMVTTLRRAMPEKRFYSASPEKLICPNMKMTTIHSIIRSLENLDYKIEIEEEFAKPARLALERMLEVVG